MNGLDPKGMREFREMILSLREKGVSVLVSSHQLSDIEQIADHLIVVQKGKVTHQVAMAELKAEKNVLIIKTDDNAETEALLKASFEVEVLQVADELQVTLATDQRSAIAAAIVTAGIGLKELRTKQSSLEDTFLAWTEEGGL
jgi:ABC-2 type transport system ATP-binding protein